MAGNQIPLIKAEPDSPTRCQGSDPQFGQCMWESMPGFTRCRIHGHFEVKKHNNREIRNYRLKKYQNRIMEFAESPQIKSLREELGILRLMLEEIINRCDTTTDLIMYSNKIQDIIRDIERIVVSIHKLEVASNIMLDKSQILHIANKLLELITENVEDVDVLDKIALGVHNVIEVSLDNASAAAISNQ